MAKIIPLTKGKSAIVDNADFEWLSQYKWYFAEKGGAARMIRKDGKRIQLYMARIIMGASPSQRIDHKNRNNLDNRRENLRFANRSQNRMNSKKRIDNTTGYKGVTMDRRNKFRQFQANITINGKTMYLGAFLTAKKAAIAYNETAINIHGEFASINHFPPNHGA